MIVEFGKEGRSLGTRENGRRIRAQILDGINTNGFVILDFKGVDMLSNSFADECIGKLVDEVGIDKMKASTTFKNTSREVSLVLMKAINDRLAMPA